MLTECSAFRDKMLTRKGWPPLSKVTYLTKTYENVNQKSQLKQMGPENGTLPLKDPINQFRHITLWSYTQTIQIIYSSLHLGSVSQWFSCQPVMPLVYSLTRLEACQFLRLATPSTSGLSGGCSPVTTVSCFSPTPGALLSGAESEQTAESSPSSESMETPGGRCVSPKACNDCEKKLDSRIVKLESETGIFA